MDIVDTHTIRRRHTYVRPVTAEHTEFSEANESSSAAATKSTARHRSTIVLLFGVLPQSAREITPHRRHTHTHTHQELHTFRTDIVPLVWGKFAYTVHVQLRVQNL